MNAAIDALTISEYQRFGNNAANMPKPYLVFDVDEALIDVTALGPAFEQLLAQEGAMRLWFASRSLYAQALAQAGTYVSLATIGEAVFEQLARARSVPVTALQWQQLADAFASMPPYPDVPTALTRLRNAGFRLFTLADSPLETQKSRLTAIGVADCFESHLSSAEVKAHKPNRRAYAYAETRLNAPPARFCLVTCHAWDAQGALGAGWQAALIERPWIDVLSIGPQPDLIGADLQDVVDELIARYE